MALSQQQLIEIALAEFIASMPEYLPFATDAVWDGNQKILLHWIITNLPGGIAAATLADSWEISASQVAHLLKRDPNYVSKEQKRACFDELRSRLKASDEKALFLGQPVELSEEQNALLANLGGVKGFQSFMSEQGAVVAGGPDVS